MARPYVRSRVLLVCLALLAGLLLSTCASRPKAGDPPVTGEPITIVEGTPLLFFVDDEGTAQLVADMEAGRTPSSCNVLYDQMGGLPDVTVTDPDTIAQIYQLLSQIIVLEDSNMSITDSYHHVFFTLEDGTKVGFSFEGERLLSLGNDTYGVDGGDALWSFVRQLQDEQLAQGEVHRIVVSQGADLVFDCPAEARAGETVSLSCAFVTDGELRISVNGQGLGQFQDEGTYVFTMPDEDVDITISVDTSGYPGA